MTEEDGVERQVVEGLQGMRKHLKMVDCEVMTRNTRGKFLDFNNQILNWQLLMELDDVGFSGTRQTSDGLVEESRSG